MVRVTREAWSPPVSAAPALAPRRQVRLLAAILMLLWAATAIAVALAYRPGGPIDLVVLLASSLPVLVAAVGVARPAVAAGPRQQAVVIWLWIIALLLVIPVLYGVSTTLAAGGPQNLVPSAEAAYAGLLALFAMSFFSLTGPVHGRRGLPVFERVATLETLGLAGLTTAVVGLAFGFVAVINDQELRPAAAVSSAFGPTDPDLLPPLCDEPVALGSNARIDVLATSAVDDVERGRAVLQGRRQGRDEAWGGSWEGEDGAGAIAYLRVGTRAWLNPTSDDPESPGSTWGRTLPDPFQLAGDDGLTMDGPPHAVIDVPRGSIVVEDIGLEIIDAARARHCRTFVDGPTALAAFLPLRWLLDDHPLGSEDRLRHWRGELDWWVFGDGELGRATVEVSGVRTDTGWDTDGVQATLRAELEATDRDRRAGLARPLPQAPASGLEPGLESSAP